MNTLRTVALCLAGALATGAADAQQVANPALFRARELDQQGVRAFRDGRYKDAIRFFQEARRLGGPSSEIWNIARCHQRLDEPERALEAFERYLAEQDLTPYDRATAARERDELRRRPSQLSVDTDPPGASVLIDGRPFTGTTPLALDLPPGRHHVQVQALGYKSVDYDVDANLGRAILLSVPLAPAGVDYEMDAAHEPLDARTRHVALSLEGGITLPRMGSVTAGVRPGMSFAAHYVAYPNDSLVASAGLRFVGLTYSSDTMELGGLAAFGLAYRVHPRVRLGGELGVGVAGLLADASGSGGVAPLGRAALAASFFVAPPLRILLSPVVFELHPAFTGARADGTGVWWRLGTTAGIAVDF